MAMDYAGQDRRHDERLEERWLEEQAKQAFPWCAAGYGPGDCSGRCLGCGENRDIEREDDND